VDGGDEAVHGILDIMYAKVPYTTLQRAVHIHPTVSELIPTILAELKPRPLTLNTVSAPSKIDSNVAYSWP
jgi:hypothetical protein